MNNSWLVITTGFALFSMFFGSGNLIFPINVGQESAGHTFFTWLGIFLSCVIVPFLGVFGMLLYEGDLGKFFGCLGKKGAFIISLICLSLLGPFGVVARCLTVAHGSLLLLFPTLSLPLASFLMCLMIYFFSLNKNRVISIIGSILTPALLFAILSIAYFALKQDAEPVGKSLLFEEFAALKNGFFQGYQMMDLLAGFFFSKFLIEYLHRSVEKSHLLKVFLKSTTIGAFLLSMVYFLLVLMGWFYAPILQSLKSEEKLSAIAVQALGDYAAPFVCIAVSFACLTTAIVLNSLFAEFLSAEITKNKIGKNLSLLITLAIAFSVSTLEFSGIAKFLGPIVEMLYPPLIALTLFNIANHYLGLRLSHWPFTVTLIARLCTI